MTAMTYVRPTGQTDRQTDTEGRDRANTFGFYRFRFPFELKQSTNQQHNTLLVITSSPVAMRDIAVSVSVCLSVCSPFA